MKRMTFTIIILLALLTLFTAGCQKKEGQSSTSGSTGLANPASEYCQGLGFDEETREGNDGQYGVCIFPNGSECDSWDFLAGRCGQVNSYCAQQGGELKSNDTNIGTCTFANGATCDELQFFNGECKP